MIKEANAAKTRRKTSVPPSVRRSPLTIHPSFLSKLEAVLHSGIVVFLIPIVKAVYGATHICSGFFS